MADGYTGLKVWYLNRSTAKPKTDLAVIPLWSLHSIALLQIGPEPSSTYCGTYTEGLRGLSLAG